jgi:2-amino-4-hydroxy-6-hydroxymethyldihydropteridine diphosphokinase
LQRFARSVVGIGSNLGDRLGYLEFAVRKLAELTVVIARSRTYETAPWGAVPQGPYLNAAVLVHWSMGPHALLRALLRIERDAGRVRDVRYGPRTLDLDLLWMEGIREVSEGLEIPHPRLHERAFALWPLLDVAPFARDVHGNAYERPPFDGLLAVDGTPTPSAGK